MNRATYWFCRTVLLLDRIPRYGRTYEMKVPDEGEDWDKVTIGPAEWSYHKYGYWGLNLLDRMGLMWKYIDYTNPWEEDKDAIT